MVRIPDRKTGFYDATNFTALAGQQTTHEFKLTGFDFLEAGEIYCENCNLGDWVRIKLVDVDNVLGAGPNYVLLTYIRKVYVFPDMPTRFSGEANKLPANSLYLQAIYNSTGASDVNIYANIKGYKNK